MQLILAAMVVVPLVGGIALSLIPASQGHLARKAALVISGAVLAASVWLWASFLPGPGMQFELNLPWIPGLGTAFHLGVDGMSLPMVFLTALLTVLAVVASRGIDDRVCQYFTLLLLLEAGLIGVFVSLDLHPVLPVLGGRAHPDVLPHQHLGRRQPRLRRGEVLHLHARREPGHARRHHRPVPRDRRADASTCSSWRPRSARLPANVQTAIFIAIAVGLAVKVPIFPLHTWLPDAHVEAPTAVSVLLAGVLLKMGSLRLPADSVRTLLPEGFKALLPLIAVLAVISIVYGAALALVQTDMKKLVAYSSISHMGYVMLGISAGTAAGFMGAQVQMFSHGLIAGAAVPAGRARCTSALTPARSRRSAASRRSSRSWPARWCSRPSPRSGCRA